MKHYILHYPKSENDFEGWTIFISHTNFRADLIKFGTYKYVAKLYGNGESLQIIEFCQPIYTIENRANNSPKQWERLIKKQTLFHLKSLYEKFSKK